MKEKPETNFRKLLQRVAYGHDTRRVFDAFVRMAACALAMQTREDEYLEEAKRWKPEELQRFAQALGCLTREMEQHPFEDILGTFYMEFALSESGQQWHGEFHTPKEICECMAELTLADLPRAEPDPDPVKWNDNPTRFRIPADKETLTVQEPACGSGAMILAVAQAIYPADRRKLRVTAIDINQTACDMCFINTTLWGIPCRVVHGNTLSMEFWHQWENVHWMMPWLPLALRLENAPAPEPCKILPPPPINGKLKQQELVLA